MPDPNRSERVFDGTLIKVDVEVWDAGTREVVRDVKGEDAAGCVARELLEETGHRATRLERLGTIYTSPDAKTVAALLLAQTRIP